VGGHTNDLKKTRILLVDDDDLVRDVLREQLETTGFMVVTAANGTEAVAAFEAEGVDLLLTDFAMPGIDGVTLITRLRGFEPCLPAILMTGYAADGGKISENKSYRLLRKPFTMERLEAEVFACLSIRAHC
jgi:CheY-like chemotaxis protein